MGGVWETHGCARHFSASGKWRVSILLTFFWSVALLLSSGCAVSRLGGKQILEAPNQNTRIRTAKWAAHWTNLLGHITTNPLRSTNLVVGPPVASLAVLEVPPEDYRCRFVGHIAGQTNTPRRFTLFMRPETNRVFRPRTEPATIVLLHGYGMTKESMAPWAFTLAQEGYRVLLVDLRGHGESTGDTIGFGTVETRDLRQALDALIASGRCDERVGVLGLSYGATLALHWAAADARIRAVAAIAPFDRADEAISRFAAMLRLPVPQRVVRHATGGAAKKLHIDWDDWSASTAMRGIEQPVLLIGGATDPISRPEDIAAIEHTGAGEVRSIILPEVNHYIVGYVFEQIAEPVTMWFDRHLGGNSEGRVARNSNEARRPNAE